MTSPQETPLGHELRQLVSTQPFSPDIDAIGQRARKKQRQRAVAMRSAVSAGAAVVVAGGVFTAVHGTGGTATATAASPAPKASTAAAAPKSSTTDPESGANGTLMSLAASVTASSGSQPGDASLVITDETIGGKVQAPEYFIYADNGDVYGAQSESGLPAAVAGHDTYHDDGLATEVAVARYAATGDLTKATVEMVDDTGGTPLGLGLSPAARQKAWEAGRAQAAKVFKMKGLKMPADSGPPTGKALQEQVGNLLWTGSMEALSTAGGNPEVKAGVLRLLATVPEVTVAKSTTDGRPTLTLTGSTAIFGGYGAETLTIDATTGAPIESTSAAGKGGVAASESYRVSRVTLADVAKGNL